MADNIIGGIGVEIELKDNLSDKIEASKKKVFQFNQELKETDKEIKSLQSSINELSKLDVKNPSVKKQIEELKSDLEKAFSKQIDLKFNLKTENTNLNGLKTQELEQSLKSVGENFDSGVSELTPALEDVKTSVEGVISSLETTQDGWIGANTLGDVISNVKTSLSALLIASEDAQGLMNLGGPETQIKSALADVGYAFTSMLTDFVDDCREVGTKTNQSIEEVEVKAIQALLNIKSAAESVNPNIESSANAGSSSGSGLQKGILTGVKALAGVRGIYMLIRKIVSQNENLTNAINNLFSTVGGILAPILNFLAGLINGISDILKAYFKISIDNANSNAKTANNTTGFDELNVIGDNSSSSSTSSTEPYSLKEWYDDITKDVPEATKKVLDKALEPYATNEEDGYQNAGRLFGQIGRDFEDWWYSLDINTMPYNEKTGHLFDNSEIANATGNLWEAIRQELIDEWNSWDGEPGSLIDTEALEEKWNSWYSKKMEDIFNPYNGNSGNLFKSEMWNNFLDGFKEWNSGVSEKLNDLVGNFVDSFEEIDTSWNNLKDALGDSLRLEWALFKLKLTTVKIKITKWWDDMKETISKKVEEIANDIKSGLESAFNWVKEQTQSMSSNYENNGQLFTMLGIEIPKLATGTNYVQDDGLAYLHQGEAVVPKQYNPALGNSDNREVVTALYTILDALNSKDMSVTIGDDVIGRANNRYTQKVGRTIISGSFANSY